MQLSLWSDENSLENIFLYQLYCLNWDILHMNQVWSRTALARNEAHGLNAANITLGDACCRLWRRQQNHLICSLQHRKPEQIMNINTTEFIIACLWSKCNQELWDAFQPEKKGHSKVNATLKLRMYWLLHQKLQQAGIFHLQISKHPQSFPISRHKWKPQDQLVQGPSESEHKVFPKQSRIWDI